MPKAIHTGSSLALNASNHPSIPARGLTLEADIPTPVTDAQAAYLRELPDVTILPDPKANQA